MDEVITLIAMTWASVMGLVAGVWSSLSGIKEKLGCLEGKVNMLLEINGIDPDKEERK